jgi:hypothetical protein
MVTKEEFVQQWNNELRNPKRVKLSCINIYVDDIEVYDSGVNFYRKKAFICFVPYMLILEVD